MTYGEYKVKIKDEVKMKDGELYYEELKFPKKMAYHEALWYYTDKLNKVWESEGYYDLHELSVFPKRLRKYIVNLIKYLRKGAV